MPGRSECAPAPRPYLGKPLPGARSRPIDWYRTKGPLSLVKKVRKRISSVARMICGYT